MSNIIAISVILFDHYSKLTKADKYGALPLLTWTCFVTVGLPTALIGIVVQFDRFYCFWTLFNLSLGINWTFNCFHKTGANCEKEKLDRICVVKKVNIIKQYHLPIGYNVRMSKNQTCWYIKFVESKLCFWFSL